MWGREEPQRVVVGANLFVERGGKRIGTLDPRLNYFRTSEQPVATPAVRSRGGRRSLREPDGVRARRIVRDACACSWSRWWRGSGSGGMIVALGALSACGPAATTAHVGAAPACGRARAEPVEEEEPAAAAEGDGVNWGARSSRCSCAIPHHRAARIRDDARSARDPEPAAGPRGAAVRARRILLPDECAGAACEGGASRCRDTVRLDSLRGKVVVLNFWASWCLACRDEHAALSAAARRSRAPTRASSACSIRTCRRTGATGSSRWAGSRIPGLFDPESRTAIDYGLYGVPETFFIGRDGRVAYKHVGAVTNGRAHGHGAELLAEQPGAR